MPMPFVPGRDPKAEKGIRTKDILRPPILHHIAAMACEDDLGESRQSASGHSRSLRTGINSHVYHCNKPTERGNEASGSAALCLGSGRLPTPP